MTQTTKRSFKNVLFAPNTKIKRPFGIDFSGGVSVNTSTVLVNDYMSFFYTVYSPFDFEYAVKDDKDLVLKFQDSDSYIRINGFRGKVPEGQVKRNSLLGYAGTYDDGLVLEFSMYGDESMKELIHEKFGDIEGYTNSYLCRLLELNNIGPNEGFKALDVWCERNLIEEFNDFYIKKRTDPEGPVQWYYNYYALF